MNWRAIEEFVTRFIEADPQGEGFLPDEGPLRHALVLPLLLAVNQWRHAIENEPLVELRDLCHGPICQVVIGKDSVCRVALRPEVIANLNEIGKRADEEEATALYKQLERLWAEEARLVEIIGEHTVAPVEVQASPSLRRVLAEAARGGVVAVATEDLDSVYAEYGV